MDRKTRRQYDGVIYTPGRRATKKRRVQTRRKVKKTNFAIFYAITLFTGIVVCIVVFATMFNSMLPGETAAPKPTAQASAVKESPTAVAVEQTAGATGLIKTIGGGSDKIIVIYDVDEFKTYNLIVDNTAELKNKYGQAIAFAELSVGDIVDIVYETRGNLLKSLKHSGQAWEHRQATKTAVDYAERTVAVGNDVYSYTDELISLSRGLRFDIENIKPIDVVTLKGYKDKLWYADLVRSHGYLDFSNKELVIDGILEIDNNYAKELADAEKMEILEGSHRVVVRGFNIETYLREITVERGETYILDLNDVQYKMGVVNVNINVEEYSLYINGAETTQGEAVAIDYGDYDMKITKEGYLPWEEKIKINEPIININVELQEELQICKLTINTYPAGAELYIDNSYVGVSPLTTPIVYGRHKLIYKKPGYRTTDFEFVTDKPAEVFDIYLQEEEPIMPPVYGF